jgi:cation transport protein ChaC
MAELRRESFTPENVGRFEAWLRAQGVDVLPREMREAALQRALAATAADEDVWLFGYGSLMWNPACEVAESRAARLHGFHRRFCLWNTFGRGTPERPGLMLALEPGGCCAGVALRIEATRRESELGRIWTREMMTGAYRARWVSLETGEGAVRALTFVANRESPRYAGRLSPGDTTRCLRQGAGPLGTSREYLERVVRHLEAMGLADGEMHALLRAVRRP